MDSQKRPKTSPPIDMTTHDSGWNFTLPDSTDLGGVSESSTTGRPGMQDKGMNELGVGAAGAAPADQSQSAI
ncbi:hypothetical protein SVAN01_11581 [Stagonosporopsis vannaccii]|nr:hypothetical protein SVAN01_11581 [Stagonosporopsis vannaccii]